MVELTRVFTVELTVIDVGKNEAEFDSKKDSAAFLKEVIEDRINGFDNVNVTKVQDFIREV